MGNERVARNLPPEFMAPGHARRGGNKKGSKHRKTIIREVLLGKRETLDLLARGSAELKLPPRHERFSTLLQKASGPVKVQLEKFLAEQDWGRAKETHVIEGGITLDVAVRLGPCQNDPATFVREFLRPRPWLDTNGNERQLRSWQLRVCDAIRAQIAAGNRKIKVHIRSCHGAGKTFLAAALVLWWLFTRRRSRILTLAPTWSGVEELLWPEIAKLYAGSLLPGFGSGRLLSTKLDLGETWYAIGAASDRPEHLEGHQSDTAAMRVVDEAKAVEKEIFDATEGMLGAPETLDLWISTPSIQDGEYYRRDVSKDEGVVRIVTDVDELIADGVPGKAEWKADRRASWGEESAEYRSRVMAQYIDVGGGALFPLSWIERAMAQTFVSNDRMAPGSEAWQKVAGMDVAGSKDGDRNAIAVVGSEPASDRVEMFSLESWHEQDTMKSAGRLNETLLRPSNAGAIPRVDTIGIGKGVCDFVAAEEYRASDRPVERDRFVNRKAEDAWAFRKRLEAGRVALARLSDEAKQELKAELCAMRYEILRTGKLQVIDPTDSPDLADALLIAQAPERLGVTTSNPEWI